MNGHDYAVARERMVREQVLSKGIKAAPVLTAMMDIPRHVFMDPPGGAEAYADHALPLGFGQTMSQPYMVAYLAEQLQLTGSESVLEIGCGSGYQAAVLSRLAGSVFTVERIAELAAQARDALDRLGVRGVQVRVGDGALGWPEQGPFDRILLTAAADRVPQTLLTQLRDGGMLLGPVVRGPDRQEIVRLTRVGDGYDLERLRSCSFVPLVREGAPMPTTTDPTS